MEIEEGKQTEIYSLEMDRRVSPYAGVLGLIFGAAFLGWYGVEVQSSVASDIRNFPSSFHSDPVLTIIFSLLKVWGYLWFPYLAATWVYAPVRDIAAKRVRRGKLLEVVSVPAGEGATWWASIPLLGWFLSWGMPVPGRSAMKVIRLGEQKFRVPNAPALDNVLMREDLIGKEVHFSLGAFNRVLSIELLGSYNPRD
jgi:hypothetical protein